MLHILLLILKIIGIVLLVILGVLLLGIVCALFVPVRYRIEAVRREGEEEPPVRVRVKVTWLLHLINILFRFDGELFLRVRILIFTILRMPKKERQHKKAEKGEEKKSKRDHKKEEPDIGESQESRAKEPEITQTIPEEENAGPAEFEKQEESKEQVEAEEWEETGDAQEKTGLTDKLRAILTILQRLIEKIRGFFENIEYTINRFCDKIRSVSETIEYYREVVEGEPFKRSFALCKDELLAVVKSLKPRKFEATLIVGMEDPASTGEILAICGMLYPIIGGHVDVRGDFEKKRLEGQVLIVGKLRMFTFLRTAFRIYFNKDIRKLYKLLKRRQ